MNNPCVRCGKQRIILKEWKETIDTAIGPSVVYLTKTVCPDPECQKQVEAKQEATRIKDEEIKSNFEKRAVEKKAEREALKVANAKKSPAKKK